MRENKFRGKCLKTKEWVYGYYTPDMLEKTHKDMVNWAFIKEYRYNTTEVITHKVCKNSVGQYAGFCDESEKEIYVGDIVLGCDGVFQQCSWAVENTLIIKDLVYDAHKLAQYHRLYVLGNIHDAPNQVVEVDRRCQYTQSNCE